MKDAGSEYKGPWELAASTSGPVITANDVRKARRLRSLCGIVYGMVILALLSHITPALSSEGWILAGIDKGAVAGASLSAALAGMYTVSLKLYADSDNHRNLVGFIIISYLLALMMERYTLLPHGMLQNLTLMGMILLATFIPFALFKLKILHLLGVRSI